MIIFPSFLGAVVFVKCSINDKQSCGKYIMYLTNASTEQYYAIVNNAIARIPQNVTRKEAKRILTYTERHHIIPKSMGGSDDHANLVWFCNTTG